MKILFLTPWYPDDAIPNHGIFIRDQADSLAAKGHEVRVICCKVDYGRFGVFSRTVKTITEGNITVTRVMIAGSIPVFNQLNFFAVCLSETMKVIRSFHPDLLHGNIGYPGAFWTWLASRRSGIPWVITEHTLLHNNFRSPVHRLLTIAFMKRAAQVITVSRHSAAVIRRHTEREAVVIPNIVDFSRFDSIASFPTAPPARIGFLGSSFFRKKGFDLLMKSVQGIQGIELHIGGKDATDHERFLQLAETAKVPCVFHGALRRDQVPAFMQGLHFFVSASRFESFGVAIAEALACGLPVVTTDSGGPSDFVGEDDGLLVPLDDSQQLGEAIRRMTETYRDYDRKAMRSRVVARFSSATVAAQIEAVYADVLKEA